MIDIKRSFCQDRLGTNIGKESRENVDVCRAEGVPVKMAVIADLVDISQRSGVELPFDEVVDVSDIKRVKATTNLSQAEQQANSKQ